MEPDLVGLGGAGELVVLQVVLAHQDGLAGGGGEAHGLGGRQLLHLAATAVGLDVAEALQLLAQLEQLGFLLALAQVVHLPLEVVQLGAGLLDLLGGQRLGVPGLLVQLEVLLGVLARGELLVQLHLQHGHALFIVVGHLHAALALLGQVQVGGEQLALEPVFLHALAAQQGLLLQSQLALAALDVLLQRAVQRGALLLDALGHVPGAVEGVHGLGEGGEGLRAQVGAAEIGEGDYVHGGAVVVVEDRWGEVLRDGFEAQGDALAGGAKVDLVAVGVLGARGAEGQLPSRLGGHATDGLGDQLVQRAAPPGERGVEAIRLHMVEGDLAVGRGQLVAQAGQHLPHGGDLLVDPAGTVDDPPVAAYEDQVGVLAHELADQPLRGAVSQLVVVLDLDFEDAVALDLANGAHPAAGDVLAHQHAQGRGLQGIVLAGGGQVGPGAIGRGGEQQLAVDAAAADGEDDLVPLRLDDLGDAPVRQRPVQFAGHQAEGQSVDGHCGTSVGVLRFLCRL